MLSLSSVLSAKSPPFGWIDPEDVHVWHIPMTQAVASGLEAWLDDAERAALGTMASSARRLRHTVTRGAMRWLLGRYLNLTPHELRFTRSESGKPRLADTEPDRGLVFNLSDSGAQVLLAIARDRALGVDVECHRPVVALERLAARCLAPSEWAHWEAQPESARLETFFRYWTAKEAFVKAVGRGLSLGLQRCAVDLGGNARMSAVPAECGLPGEWSLQPLDLNHGGISAALCARGTIGRVRLACLPDEAWTAGETPPAEAK